jgi:hypothetical protein
MGLLSDSWWRAMNDDVECDPDTPNEGKNELATMAPEVSEALAFIGIITMMVQIADSAINLCLKHVWPDQLDLTVDTFPASGKGTAKPTLGNLVSELRKRLVVDESFARYLQEFVRQRNEFTHRLIEIDGFAQISTSEGQRKIIQYCQEFAKTIGLVMVVFTIPLLPKNRRRKGEQLLPGLGAEVFKFLFVPTNRTKRVMRRRDEMRASGRPL